MTYLVVFLSGLLVGGTAGAVLMVVLVAAGQERELGPEPAAAKALAAKTGDARNRNARGER